MASTDMSLDVGTAAVVQPFTRTALGFIPGNLFLSVETESVRFWYSGSNPTPSSGHLIGAGGNAVFRKTAEIENLKLIATAGTARISATVGGS